MLVLRRFRRVLFTGFIGGESWSSLLSQAPILSHFGQADNPRRLDASDDESTDFAFAFHDDLHVEEFLLDSGLLYVLPARAFEGQSLPWGRSISLFTGGLGIGDLPPHPTSTLKL